MIDTGVKAQHGTPPLKAKPCLCPHQPETGGDSFKPGTGILNHPVFDHSLHLLCYPGGRKVLSDGQSEHLVPRSGNDLTLPITSKCDFTYLEPVDGSQTLDAT